MSIEFCQQQSYRHLVINTCQTKSYYALKIIKDFVLVWKKQKQNTHKHLQRHLQDKSPKVLKKWFFWIIIFIKNCFVKIDFGETYKMLLAQTASYPLALSFSFRNMVGRHGRKQRRKWVKMKIWHFPVSQKFNGKYFYSGMNNRIQKINTMEISFLQHILYFAGASFVQKIVQML